MDLPVFREARPAARAAFVLIVIRAEATSQSLAHLALPRVESDILADQAFRAGSHSHSWIVDKLLSKADFVLRDVLGQVPTAFLALLQILLVLAPLLVPDFPLLVVHVHVEGSAEHHAQHMVVVPPVTVAWVEEGVPPLHHTSLSLSNY